MPVVSTAKDIRAQALFRRRWLDRALAELQEVPAVVAVWLWGSGGRGDDDALSDWDIFVALADVSDLAQLDPARWVRQFGEVLSWHEDSYNAPTEGRYVAAAYPGPYSPMPVDWYLQPSSAVQIGRDTRTLVERSPLPRAPVETAALFPNVANEVEFVLPSDPVERIQHHLNWFWFMFAPMAKWTARGDSQRTREQVEDLARVFREAGDLVGQKPAVVADAETNVFDAVRNLGRAMASIHPDLRLAGVEPPPESNERLRTLEEADAIRRQGWLG